MNRGYKWTNEIVSSVVVSACTDSKAKIVNILNAYRTTNVHYYSMFIINEQVWIVNSREILGTEASPGAR